MAKKRKRYVPGGSSGALSMTAAAAPKQDPYRFIRDGKKQQVAGRANLPTARQKDLASYVLPSQDSITAIREGEAGAMDIADVALSLPGLAAVKPIVKGAKNMGILKKGVELLGEASKKLTKGDGKNKFKPSGASASNRTPTPTPPKGKGTPPPTGANRRRANRARKRAADKPDVINAPPPKPQAQLPKPKPIRGTDQTSGPTIRAGDKLGGATPAVRKSTTPAATPKPKTPPKDKDKVVGLSPLGKGVIGGTLAAGTAAYLLQSEKDAKPAKSSQAPVNKEPTVDKMSGYQLADDTNIRSPRKAAPKPVSKPAPEKDDGYRYYGKEGTGLGDFSRKFGFKYATPEQFEKEFNMDNGEQMGGRPGKSKMKTQGLNRSKRSGFSGRGTGAALRGF